MLRNQPESAPFTLPPLGHKPPASTSLNLPGSVAACDALGTALAAAYKLQYDPGHCQAIQALYKWFVPEKSTGSDVMYL